MSLSLKKITVSLLSLMALQTTVASAADVLTIVRPTDQPQTEYWTPERMRNATPMPMPTVDPGKVVALPGITPNHVVGSDGALPSSTTLPTPTLLFPQIKSPDKIVSEKVTEDHGTFNEEFSSTRLIPLSADKTYPYSTVGKLFFTIPGSGDYVCSASAIKPRIIVTAGHCVHKGSGGGSGFYTNWKFVPAYRDGSAPFSTWNWAAAGVSNGWATGGGTVPNAEDWAMIAVQDQVISGSVRKLGQVTGWLGWQTNSLFPNHLNMLGYPCNLDRCAKMHQVTAQSSRVVAPNNVEYGSDMGGGSSGGPWVQNFGALALGQTGGLNSGLNRVVGVTSYGYVSPQPMAQGAANFNNDFVSLLNTMCSIATGNCA